MPLDPSKLQMVKLIGDGGFIARCPACAAGGGDSKGVHLRQFPDGAFACAAHPGDGPHRRAVYSVAGTGKAAGIPLPASKPAVPFVRFVRRVISESNRLPGPVLPDGRRATILRHLWPPEAIRKESPVQPPTNPMAQALAVVRLFRPRDVVWMGSHYDSGKEKHAQNFRTAAAWIQAGRIPGPRICPAAFVPGVKVRARRTVRVRRFLVFEADELTKPEQGAVLRWLKDLCRLRLRAVVDTAGRSLHGWFDAPPESEIERLRALAVRFGTDPALFNPAQPCRLPGWPREDTGAMPSLLYLCP